VQGVKIFRMPMNAIIVEDEPLSRIFLSNLLSEFCPDVKVIATVSTEDDAVESIITLQPQLVFLDIELQTGTGFEVLKRISGTYPSIVVTTAFDHHAIRAVQFSGVDYLQKPIEISALQQVVLKLTSKQDKVAEQIAIAHLLETIGNNYEASCLAVMTTEGIDYLTVEDIIRVEAVNTGSQFILRGGSKKVIHTNLKEYELLLQDYSFCRIHQSHLINVNEILPGSGISDGHITMIDGSKVPVSPKKIDEMKKYC
jgi:two-component system, LytTR family, response regulator